jgi:uncharacterized protein YggE
MNTPFRRLMLGMAVLVWFSPVVAVAQEPGITVLGTGEVLAKPDCLEIEVRASAEAELTGDAVVKYDDSLRRIRGAFTKLDVKDLAVEERELSVASGAEAAGGLAAVMAAQNKAASKANIQLTRSLRLVVRKIDKLPEAEVIGTISKLLDASKDAGAKIGKEGSSALLQAIGQGGGASPVVHFVVEHPEEMREQAYQKAFDEATARARRLAKLAQSRLGQAVSIEEIAAAAPAKEAGMQERMLSAIYGIETTSSDDPRLSSDKLIDIPVRVTLRVRFSLANDTSEKGPAANALP